MIPWERCCWHGHLYIAKSFHWNWKIVKVFIFVSRIRLLTKGSKNGKWNVVKKIPKATVSNRDFTALILLWLNPWDSNSFFFFVWFPCEDLKRAFEKQNILEWKPHNIFLALLCDPKKTRREEFKEIYICGNTIAGSIIERIQSWGWKAFEGRFKRRFQEFVCIENDGNWLNLKLAIKQQLG